MTEIYLIRHAQAEGNRYRMMQGQWDGDVTDLGRRQIEELALRFREEPVDLVWSSDLFRARLTATAATRWQQLPLHTDEALREINIGPWETLFFGNVCHDEPESARIFMFDSEHWVHEGAETYGQVADRAYACMERIARENPGKRIALFSHGVTLRCIMSRVTGIGLNDTEHLPICRNTAVSKLTYENGVITPVFYNDDSHLSEGSRAHWSLTGDLRHVRFDPDADREYYVRCYADAWQTAHGSLAGFQAEVYLDAALRHHAARPGSVLRFYRQEEPVGLLDMDPGRGAHAGYGWISLLYLHPEYRNQGYGIQLLARAYELCRLSGRRSLRLHVADANAMALAFYRREGFRELSREHRGQGDLLLMEKKLGGPRDVR